MADSRTKDAKHVEKIGRKHKTAPSSLTRATNVLTVQVITECVIVQQGSNHMHPQLATLLMVQVFTKIIHNFKIICPNNIHNKVHLWFGISTPTLMINNQLQMGPQQGQQWHPSPQAPPVSQQANSPIRHNQFNQHLQQPPMPQVSPLMAPPQQYNPQIPPPYFHQYPPTNSPSGDSNELLLARVFHRQMDIAERQEKHDQERGEREKCKEE